MYVDDGEQPPPSRADDAAALDPDPHRHHVLRVRPRVGIHAAENDEEPVVGTDRTWAGFRLEQHVRDGAVDAAFLQQPLAGRLVADVDMDPKGAVARAPQRYVVDVPRSALTVECAAKEEVRLRC